MIVKIDKVLSCSSEHPSYPASNLIEYNSNIERSSWRCAEPGELMAYVILQLKEPVPIIGVDIGNYRSCIVIVTGSTTEDPDNWRPIINYQFVTHDDAECGRFKDQVQLFTRKEINAETIKMKFDRIKITCMQSSNLKVLFGLSFLILRTEDPVQQGLDIFGRFKMKEKNDTNIDKFKEKFLQQIRNNETTNYKEQLANQIKENKSEAPTRNDDTSKKRPLLKLLESGETDKVFGSDKKKSTSRNPDKSEIDNNTAGPSNPVNLGILTLESSDAKTTESSTTSKRGNMDVQQEPNEESRKPSAGSNINPLSIALKKSRCSLCLGNEENMICKNCNRLLPENSAKLVKKSARPLKKQTKPKVPFEKLYDGIVFSLSGYVNPERDAIRRKAIEMGGRYVANVSRNHRCTHLICAFKNTPKYCDLKGRAKIVSHRWVLDCHNQKKRISWRKYALDDSDRDEPASEEEIEAGHEPNQSQSPYDQDTDSDN